MQQIWVKINKVPFPKREQIFLIIFHKHNKLYYNINIFLTQSTQVFH